MVKGVCSGGTSAFVERGYGMGKSETVAETLKRQIAVSGNCKTSQIMRYYLLGCFNVCEAMQGRLIIIELLWGDMYIR